MVGTDYYSRAVALGYLTNPKFIIGATAPSCYYEATVCFFGVI
jgi:hypothetical protein